MERAGRVLKARYKIIEMIGNGGSGIVYEAADLKDSRCHWAVKEIICTDDENKENIRLAESELSLLSRLNHPNIPKFLESFEENGRFYLVMEHIDGKSLDRIMKERYAPLPVGAVIQIGLKVARLLDYLHSQEPHPVIYRDLKPSNIMITRNGSVKLIDFGIARFFKPSRTKDTLEMGTPGFSPPEQYGRSQSDQRSDIYSLGVTLFNLLTGEDPHQYNFSLPPLSKLGIDVPEELETLLAECARYDIAERISSAEEIVKVLERLAGKYPSDIFPESLSDNEEDIPAPGPTRLLAPISNRGNRRFNRYIIAAVFLIVALTGYLFLDILMRCNRANLSAACCAQRREIKLALGRYSKDHNGAWPATLETLVPRYMKAIPDCPAPGEHKYLYHTDEKGFALEKCAHE